MYLICAYYGVHNNDWDNPYYRSMKSLINLRESHPDKISFYITEHYLGEVTGEIKKALRLSKFENYPFFSFMGETRNTLFNYYKYLKQEHLFEEDDNIEVFDDFIYSLGLDITDADDPRFYNSSSRFLSEVAEYYGISIIGWSYNERFGELLALYQDILRDYQKGKSDTAIKNDVNQVIISLEHDNESDCYLATWDTTVHLLRDKVLSEYRHLNYNYFNICNPARLSNRIALENFNIDESALTNDIFAYADKQYAISNRVKSLLELIAPFLKENGSGSQKLFRRLGRIRKQQLETAGVDSGIEREEKNLPIEEIVMLLIPSKEKQKEDESIIEKFSLFLSSEENTDYIINLINQISELKNYKSYDFTEYYEKINSIEISEVDK